MRRRSIPVLAWAAAFLPGCTTTILPEPIELRPLSRPALIQLDDVRVDFRLLGARPGAATFEHKARDLVQGQLRGKEIGSLFAESAGNLRGRLQVDVTFDNHDGNNTAWALLCGFTMGLAPVNLYMDWTLAFELSVTNVDGLAVRKFRAEQPASYNLWCYPPGLFTLIGAAAGGKVEAKMFEAALNAMDRCLASLIEQVEAEYGPLAEAQRENERLLALRRAVDPALLARLAPPEGTVAPPPAEPLPPLGQKWAVVVGVGDYLHQGEGGLTNLRYAARDARRLHEALAGGERGGWRPENMRLLTDAQATRQNVADAVLNFLKRAQKEDLVLLFFSGHGSPDPARPKNNYFLCHDTDPDRLTSTGFPMWEIQNAIEHGIIEARRVVILADACHSGGFAPAGMKDMVVVSRNVADGVKALGQGDATRVLTSSGPGELSQEKDEWGGGHGAFAYALIEGLLGRADAPKEKNGRGNGDGVVDLGELVHFVRREVGDLTANAQHVQDTGSLEAPLVGGR